MCVVCMCVCVYVCVCVCVSTHVNVREPKVTFSWKKTHNVLSVQAEFCRYQQPISRVGQNRVYTPCMTVCIVIPLLK